MGWQTIVAALLVGSCSAYALWSLLPGGLRLRCRSAFGVAAPPASASCGGCGGCGGAAPGAPARATVIRVVRRPRAG